MSSKEVALHEWIADRMRQIARFEAHWLREHGKNPEEYPLKLLEGDWEEQLEFWIERK